MALCDIPGQHRSVRFLKQLARKEMVPHAMLFSGMPGTGKLATAMEFAKLLECLDVRDYDSCGHCSACRKINEGNHPDLIRVQSDGASIKIEQIRELKERFRFRPFEGKWRVVIIEEAQKLGEQAANAILKILEEPPRENIFILVVPESQMLLQTIISRCCHVRFQPLGEQVVADLLVEGGLQPDHAMEIARLSGGSLDRARQLTDKDRIARWKEVLERLETLEGMPILEMVPMVSEWAGSREQVEQDLECVRLWIRDLILLRLAGERPLTFTVSGKTEDAVRKTAPQLLFMLYYGVEQAVRNLKVNANLQLTLEGVCLAIKESLYGKGDWYSFSKRRKDLPF
ncbi:MAG: DNA polymerase III subunit delta' [Syntrophobacteraceae bacterium]